MGNGKIGSLEPPARFLIRRDLSNESKQCRPNCQVGYLGREPFTAGVSQIPWRRVTWFRSRRRRYCLGFIASILGLMMPTEPLVGWERQDAQRATNLQQPIDLVFGKDFAQLRDDLKRQRAVVHRVCALMMQRIERDGPDFAAAAEIARQGVASELGQTVQQVQQSIVTVAALARDLSASAHVELNADVPDRAERQNAESAALETLGEVEQSMGNPRDAVRFFREASSLFDRKQEPEEWVKSVAALCSLMQQVSLYPDACGCYEQALSWALQNPVLGADHAATLELINGLAQSYAKQMCFDKAAPLFRRVLQVRERILGADHPDTLTSANNLGLVLRESGDLAGSLSLLRRALAGREQIFGLDSTETISAASDLAEVLVRAGNLHEAEPLFRRVLAFRERVLGPAHPATLGCMNNLANVLSCKGDIASAEPLLRDALAGRDRLLGPGHPDTLATLGNLACLLADKGDSVGAEPLFRRVLAAQEHNLGAEHPDALATKANLAVVLEAKGDRPEAEMLYRAVLESRSRIFGEIHPDVARSCFNLSLFLMGKKADKEAIPLAQRAVMIARATLPEGQVDRVAFERHLASLKKSAPIKSSDSKPGGAPGLLKNSAGNTTLRN